MSTREGLPRRDGDASSCFRSRDTGDVLPIPEEVKKTTVYARKRFRGKRNKVLEFTLNQLINIADELAWFPVKRITWAGKRTTLAGFSHEIRKVRNCVHPGVWSRDRSDPLKFSQGVYGVVYEVIDVANS